MPNRISKLRNRLAQALSSKEFIPPLSMFDMASGSAVPLVTYATKPEQLRTNIGWVRAANRAIVTPTASVPLKLRRLKANGDYDEIIEHEILTLLNDPHVALNGKKLRELNPPTQPHGRDVHAHAQERHPVRDEARHQGVTRRDRATSVSPRPVQARKGALL
ncbi:hypothetical protein HQQ80_21665 [Microbacteriaceae bacterium VKM Ac-2855]|nr:hypothetical protein [Microbacteriaceae bacterium VKM Ac-2855]